MGDLVWFPLFVGPPHAMAIPWSSANVDLTTVSAVTLDAINIQLAGAVEKTWAALLVPDVGQAVVLPNRARIIYAFNGTELDTKGVWRAQVRFTVANGTVDGDPQWTPTWIVTDKWGRR